MKISDRKKSIMMFTILFLGMEFFSYVFFSLFHINFNTKNEIIRIFVDLLFMLAIYFFVYNKDLKKDGCDYIENFNSFFKVSVIYYLIGLVGMYLSNYLIGSFFSQANAGNEEGVRHLVDVYPVYMFFSIVIYAPFVEEIVFRKSIFDIFKEIKNEKLKKILSVTLSGVLFSLLHVISTIKTGYDFLYIIPYLSLGIALALIYYKTKNIFSTIVIHSLHNLIALLLYMGVISIL